jgi:hypothetical protein
VTDILNDLLGMKRMCSLRPRHFPVWRHDTADDALTSYPAAPRARPCALQRKTARRRAAGINVENVIRTTFFIGGARPAQLA